jgi:transcriptional regulator with XRE-family HTH domain
MTLASGFVAPSTLRVSFVRVESVVDPVALRGARLHMGLTQHELARLIDVAGGERISRWELGSSAPRPEMLHRLAQALNVGAADLLEVGGPAGLRRLRTSAGLSARTLAARAHMSVPTYVRGGVRAHQTTSPDAGTLALGQCPQCHYRGRRVRHRHRQSKRQSGRLTQRNERLFNTGVFLETRVSRCLRCERGLRVLLLAFSFRDDLRELWSG